MNPAERAWAAYAKSLPPGTELRMANVTLGEVGGSLPVKGISMSALRDSVEYKNMVSQLESVGLGGSKGAADRALVADMFFAQSASGAIPRFITADADVVVSLARASGIKLPKAHPYGALVQTFGARGFPATLNRRTIMVVPVP
ncbi:MAG TPA: hypothetical protein VFP84_36405 [Kofleriaceae bacterium]|nr:hypothetical protein [Kofleriaceae bacterium]